LFGEAAFGFLVFAGTFVVEAGMAFDATTFGGEPATAEPPVVEGEVVGAFVCCAKVFDEIKKKKFLKF
jgi:hypothetical protein